MLVEVPEFKEFLHFDKKMENAVLGAIMLEKFTYERVMGILNEDCFYLDANKIVYSAFKKMWDASLPIDLLTVCQFIVRNMGHETINNENVPYYLSKITKEVTSSANLEYHAFLIRQLYAEREIWKIKFSSIGEGDVLSRSKRMQDELLRLSQFKITNDWKDMVDVVMELHRHMDDVKDKELIGVPTGFKKVDYITGGLCSGQLVVIAARPSVGKSALLNAMVINAATLNYKVAIISLEMPNVQVGARMGAMVSEVEFYKIFRNKIYEESERDRVYSDLEKLSNLPIRISDKTGVNVNDIKAKIAQLVNKKLIDILFIDYLQLVDANDGSKYNREQEVAKMTRGLKIIAMEYKIPIVVLAQLNREAEKDKKPKLHHLRESGAIEQDADVVMLLHRDWKIGKTENEDGSSTEYEADLILAKTRNGETPEVKIGFHPSQMRFYDLDNPQKTAIPFGHSSWKPYKENNDNDGPF